MTNSSFYYVLTIEEEKSFSRAAKKLGITQPALSSYVTKLETKLGDKIFDRTVMPVTVTEFGRAYIDYVRKSYMLEADFDKQCEDLHNLETGSIVIGGAQSFTSRYLPVPTARFHERYPGIDIKIVDARVPELKEMELAGEIDFFIAGESDEKDEFEREKILTERILICVPEQWEINKELEKYRIPESDIFDGKVVTKLYENVPVEAFADSPFVLLEEDLHVRQISDELFKRHNFVPKRSVLVGQIMTSIALTTSGVGICFMSDKTVRYGNMYKLPAFYAFEKHLAVRDITAVYDRNKYVSRASREFIRIMKECF